MTLTFLTPWAALVGLLGAFAVAALVQAERRSRRACSALGLRSASSVGAAAAVAALVLVAALLALAAAQPVLARVRPVEGRADAEAFFVFDISRSMLARERRDGAMRFDRARVLGKELRAGIPDVPAGIATLTDRVLPHLFPTVNREVFDTTVDRALGIERPPPDRLGRGRATALGALGALGRRNFFGPRKTKRVAVVFTDGESVPVAIPALARRLAATNVRLVIVRLWGEDERVFDARGRPAPDYRPDPASSDLLDEVQRATGATVVEEREVDRALDAIRKAIGPGPSAPQARQLVTTELAPYGVLAAAVPLLLLLWSRNLRGAA